MVVKYTKKDMTYKLYKAWILSGHAKEDIFKKLLWAGLFGDITNEQYEELFNLALITSSYKRMLEVAGMEKGA